MYANTVQAWTSRTILPGLACTSAFTRTFAAGAQFSFSPSSRKGSFYARQEPRLQFLGSLELCASSPLSLYQDLTLVPNGKRRNLTTGTSCYTPAMSVKPSPLLRRETFYSQNKIKIKKQEKCIPYSAKYCGQNMTAKAPSWPVSPPLLHASPHHGPSCMVAAERRGKCIQTSRLRTASQPAMPVLVFPFFLLVQKKKKEH